MKNIKILGVLLGLALVAAIVIMQNYTDTKETTPITTSKTIDVPSFSAGGDEGTEDTRRVAVVDIVYPRDGGGNERVAVVDIVYPREGRSIAIVDIVYPRIGGQGEFCGSDGPEFESISFREITQFCDMSETQINQLIGVKYEKDIFCKCVTEFCGQEAQATNFINCLKDR